jgi:hypothetical protein
MGKDHLAVPDKNSKILLKQIFEKCLIEDMNLD